MSNLNQKLSKSEITSLMPIDVSEHVAVQEKFIDMYNKIHGQHGEMIYNKESFNFRKMVSESEELKKCTPISLYSVFLDLAMNGLSLEQGSKPTAYIIPRNANVGTRENAVWEKRAYLVISPYGELLMRMRSGHIKYADNPVIVYSGDVFSVYMDDSGNKRIKYEAKIPREPNAKIIASFIKLTRPDGSVDFEYLTQEDINTFMAYSEKNNRGTANALYTSNNGGIDPGFLASKTIKHSFRTFPKIKINGLATIIEPDPNTMIEANYGFDISEPVQIAETNSIKKQDLPSFDNSGSF